MLEPRNWMIIFQSFLILCIFFSFLTILEGNFTVGGDWLWSAMVAGICAAVSGVIYYLTKIADWALGEFLKGNTRPINKRGFEKISKSFVGEVKAMPGDETGAMAIVVWDEDTLEKYRTKPLYKDYQYLIRAASAFASEVGVNILSAEGNVQALFFVKIAEDFDATKGCMYTKEVRTKLDEVVKAIRKADDTIFTDNSKLREFKVNENNAIVLVPDSTEPINGFNVFFRADHLSEKLPMRMSSGTFSEKTLFCTLVVQLIRLRALGYKV